MKKYMVPLITTSLVAWGAQAAVVQTNLTVAPTNTVISQTDAGGTELQVRATSSSDKRSASQTFVWTTDDDLDGVGFYMTSDQTALWADKLYQVSIQKIDAAGTVLSTSAFITFNINTNAVAADSWFYIDFDNVHMVNGQSYGMAFGPVYTDGYSSQRVRVATSTTHDAYTNGVGAQTSSAVAPYTNYGVIENDTWHDTAFLLTSAEEAPFYEVISQTNLTAAPLNTVISQTNANGTQLQIRNTSATDRRSASQTFVWTTDDALDGIGFYLGSYQSFWNPKRFQLSIQAINAAGTVLSTAAYIEFTIDPAIVLPNSWMYFDISELNLVNGQSYGLAFGPVYRDGSSTQKLRLTTSDTHAAYADGVGRQTGSAVAPYSSYNVTESDDWHDVAFLLTSIHTGTIEPATIVDWSIISGDIMKLVVDTPTWAYFYYPKTTTDLIFGTWTNVPHSTNGLAPFIYADLSYSAMEGSNKVIYVDASAAKGFFSIGEE